MAWGWKEPLEMADKKAKEGEVVDFNLARIETLSTACLQAKKRMERAFDELMRADDNMRAACAALSEGINTAQLGVSCAPFDYDLHQMVQRAFASRHNTRGSP
jgi:hypothetical protein